MLTEARTNTLLFGRRNPEHPLFGKTIGIIGGGPAGAFLAYLLAAEGVRVEIFEPRSTKKADIFAGETIPLCTGCAGLIQKEALDLLSAHGLEIPESVIQTKLTKTAVYFPNTQDTIEFPASSVTVYRGFSPVKQNEPLVESFDAWLLTRAIEKGAIHRQTEIAAINLPTHGKPQLTTKEGNVYEADMLVGAFGHNPRLMESITYPNTETSRLLSPKTQKAAIREYYFGRETVASWLAGRLHIFGNPTETVWFAAVIPKDKYVTVVLMGRSDIEPKDFVSFFDNPNVRRLLGNDIRKQRLNCGCSTSFTIESPKRFTVERDDGTVLLVNIGDAGPTRPRKNGIFAALDSAEKLAAALVAHGNTSKDLEKYRKYITSTYVRDNYFAQAVLILSDIVSNSPLLRQAVIYTANHRLPILTPVTASIVEHLTTGKSPYWQIPLKALKEALDWRQSTKARG